MCATLRPGLLHLASEKWSAEEAKIKIFTISFDVLSIQKCIKCDKAAKQQQQQQNCNCGLLPAVAAQIKDLIPQSGKKFACLPKDDVNDATHVLPLPGDDYEEGPLIHTGCFASFRSL